MTFEWTDSQAIGDPVPYQFPYLQFDDISQLVIAAGENNVDDFVVSIHGFPDVDENITLAQLESFFLSNDHSLKSARTDDEDAGIGPMVPVGVTTGTRSKPVEPTIPEKKIDEPAVAIAVIDTGIGFANEHFRRLPQMGLDDESRIEFLWLMDHIPVKDEYGETSNVQRGCTLSKQHIEASFSRHKRTDGTINERAIYRDFTRDTPVPGIREEFTLPAPHGTAMLDLAAGYAREQNVTNRPIFAVQLPGAVIADTSGALVTKVVEEALERILLETRSLMGQDGKVLPLVINISVAVSAGPHDGSHPFERMVNRLVEAERTTHDREIFCTVPVGNHRQDRLHAFVNFKRRHQSTEIEWKVQIDDRTASFVEIWSGEMRNSKWSDFQVNLIPPDASVDPDLKRMPPRHGTVRKLLDEKKKHVASVYYLRHNNRARIVVCVGPTRRLNQNQAYGRAGTWRLKLTSLRCCSNPVHLWIQRDDTIPGYRSKGKQSRFANAEYRSKGPYGEPIKDDLCHCEITRKGTISAFATGKLSRRNLMVPVTGNRIAPGTEKSMEVAGRPEPFLKESDLAQVTCDGGDFHRGIGCSGLLSGTAFRVYGTSAASALEAHEICDRIEGSMTGQEPKYRRPKRRLRQLVEGPGVP